MNKILKKFSIIRGTSNDYLTLEVIENGISIFSDVTPIIGENLSSVFEEARYKLEKRYSDTLTPVVPTTPVVTDTPAVPAASVTPTAPATPVANVVNVDKNDEDDNILDLFSLSSSPSPLSPPSAPVIPKQEEQKERVEQTESVETTVPPQKKRGRPRIKTPETFEEALNFKITFGKYAGELLKSIAEKDPSYVTWLATSTGVSGAANTAAKILLKEARNYETN